MRLRRTIRGLLLLGTALLLAALFAVPQPALAQVDIPDGDFDYTGREYMQSISWMLTWEEGDDTIEVVVNVKGVLSSTGKEYAPEDLEELTQGVCHWVELSEGTWQCTVALDAEGDAFEAIDWDALEGEWDWDDDMDAPPDGSGWVDDPSKLPPCPEDDPNCQWTDEMLDPGTYWPGAEGMEGFEDEDAEWHRLPLAEELGLPTAPDGWTLPPLFQQP